jgi:hypothetical protein
MTSRGFQAFGWLGGQTFGLHGYGEAIMEKLSHRRQTLEKIQPGCTLPRSKKKSNKVM